MLYIVVFEIVKREATLNHKFNRVAHHYIYVNDTVA